MLNFEVAYATIKSHAHDNNEDSLAIYQSSNVEIYVICDGCGDPKATHSGFGAEFGARALTRILKSYFSNPAVEFSEKHDALIWSDIKKKLLFELSNLMAIMNGDKFDFVQSHLLFTINGVVLTPVATTFFHIGDGIYQHNDVLTILPTSEDNAPLYIGYNLFGKDINFETESFPTTTINNFMIGSDGAIDLPTNFDLPYNTLKLTNKLHALNRPIQHVDWLAQKITKAPAKLHDDTTIIIGRRIRLDNYSCNVL